MDDDARQPRLSPGTLVPSRLGELMTVGLAGVGPLVQMRLVNQPLTQIMPNPGVALGERVENVEAYKPGRCHANPNEINVFTLTAP